MTAVISDYIYLKMAAIILIRLYSSVKCLISFQIIFICEIASIISYYKLILCIFNCKMAANISDYIYFKMAAIISDYIHL